MARISTPATLRVEDFKDEDREVAEKLANTLNPFMDEVYRQFNGNIGFENLNRQVVTLEVRINATGGVINSPQIRTSLRSKVIGTNVISAVNIENSSTYPTSHPFINGTVNGNIFTIDNVSGLQNGSRYTLTVEIIGN